MVLKNVRDVKPSTEVRELIALCAELNCAALSIKIDLIEQIPSAKFWAQNPSQSISFLQWQTFKQR